MVIHCGGGVVWVALVVSLVVIPATRGMEVVDGGYQEVIVAISPDLEEDANLITAIKKSIREMSDAVFYATRRRLFFRDVTILVPQSWSTVKVHYNATTQYHQDAIIQVERPNPAYGNKPYTVQPGGCGEPGRYIHLTPPYLNIDRKACFYGQRGKTLAREWARVRWGVFDEVGYLDDPLFPLHYLTTTPAGVTVKPNYCANQPLQGMYGTSGNEADCDQEGNDVVNNNCRFYPDYLQNATTSIMSQHFVSSITEFCDTSEDGNDDHDPLAPNKHNLMCDGRSVWSVIKEHPDFDDDKQANRETPNFLVVRKTEAKYALLFDTTRSMKENGNLDWAREATQQWILNDLREGSQVAIVRFGIISSLVKDLTKVTDGASRRALNESLSNLDTIGDGACYVCALRSIIPKIKDENNTVIVVVTDGDPDVYSPSLQNTLQQELVYLGVRVLALVFSKKKHTLMETLAESTKGRVYYTTKSSSDVPLRLFQDALSAQPRKPLSLTRFKIHETVISGKAKLFNSTFDVDSSLNRNLKFRFRTNMSSEVSSPPYFVNPSATRFETEKSEFVEGQWTAEVEDPEVGSWWWEVGLRGRKYTKVSVDISATPKPDQTPIHVEAWLNTTSDTINAKTESVSVHTRVLRGNAPVLKAQVRLLVMHSTLNTTYNLTLLDSGTGTDALAGDGIYSRLLSNLTSTGPHILMVKVWGDGNTTYKLPNAHLLSEDRRAPVAVSCSSSAADEDPPSYCCGSWVPTHPRYEKATANFTRVHHLGIYNVSSVPETDTEDTVAPCCVVDLRVTIVNITTLELKWTAAGDDFDVGAAFKYEVHKELDPTKLQCSPEDDDDTVTWPNDTSTQTVPEFGTLVTALVSLNDTFTLDVLHYVAMCAVDDAGNTSPLSNTARIILQAPEEIRRPPGLMSVLKNLSVMQYMVMCASVGAMTCCVCGH
ncbi:hypothetical protein Pmani_002988 [Petrolisthes manimaculis]|uniref:VWFA domain-containing protein n=1 Tax=Petrolisthes manimaculis TaxID=1843537 RepID=A0AAE1UJV4_9EUCA|nr:hypothetical protein Pmani_002988 [Petrolisthes manimaculis]